MNEVVNIEPQLPAVTPMQMLQNAVAQGADIARIEQLMNLQERWESAQARKAYIKSLSLFKKNMPDVVKDLINKQYNSDYSSLANLVNTTNRVLGEYGLSATWSIDQSSANVIKVSCVLAHEDGHTEQVSLQSPPDSSGAKNPLQMIKSTITYLEGATFQAITGVVARSASKDDDANGSVDDCISADQINELADLIDQAKANKSRFLEWLSISDLCDLPAKKFKAAKDQLERRIKENAKAAQ